MIRQEGQTTVGLKLARQDIEVLKSLPGLPAEVNWLSRGHVDAELEFRQLPDSPPRFTFQLGIGDVGFDSPDGRFAAEALHIDVEVSVLGNEWSSPGISGFVRSGELLIDDFYRDFSDGEMEFALRPEWLDGKVDIRSVRITDHHSLIVEARAELGSKQDPDSWGLKSAASNWNSREPMSVTWNR